MARKKTSRAKRKRQLDLLDLPNELLLSILQWCDPIAVHRLGCANKQLRTLTNHYTFHRRFPIPSPSSAHVPDITGTTRLQLHPAILHAAWRPAFGYDDIQIMMGLRTYDLVGSGIEEQAATDPPIDFCRIDSARLEAIGYQYVSEEEEGVLWPRYRQVQGPAQGPVNLKCRPLRNQSSGAPSILTVRDIFKALVAEIGRVVEGWTLERNLIYRVPLRTDLVFTLSDAPVLKIMLRPYRHLQRAMYLDPTGKRFREKAPAKRLGYGLRSSGIAAGASLP